MPFGSVVPIRTRQFVALVALLAGAACGEPMHGVEIADAEPAPSLRLVAADSTRFDLAEHQGSVVLVYFGYTHCPDVCPTTLSDWAQARRALGDRAQKVVFVFVSVDPERDTPELTQAYARQFDRTFIGLSGTEAQIDSMKTDWRIAAYAEGDTRTRDYSVAHPAHTFLVDRQGRLRYLYEPGVRGEELARDLRKLL